MKTFSLLVLSWVLLACSSSHASPGVTVNMHFERASFYDVHPFPSDDLIGDDGSIALDAFPKPVRRRAGWDQARAPPRPRLGDFRRTAESSSASPMPSTGPNFPTFRRAPRPPQASFWWGSTRERRTSCDGSRWPCGSRRTGDPSGRPICSRSSPLPRRAPSREVDRRGSRHARGRSVALR